MPFLARNMVYLAINAAHGLCAALYACHGRPHFISFGALAVRRISSSQEKHQLPQVSEISIYPRLLPYDIMVAIADLEESNQLATTIPGSHSKVFKVSPIVLEMPLRGSPATLRGSPDDLRGSPAALWGSPAALRGSPDRLRGLPDRPRGPPNRLRGLPDRP
eukprot:4377892-Pleurochrysis_carterae.AAC.1